MNYQTFEEVEEILEKYFKITNSIGVKKPSKKFNLAIEVLKSLKQYRINKGEFTFNYGPAELSSALSLLDFLKDIIEVYTHCDFFKLKNLIDKLHKSNFLQNWSTNYLKGKELNNNNVLWELYFALQIYKVGHSIELGSYNPPNKNPDIIATIDHLRWGFACKVPNPIINLINVRNYMDNLRYGIHQLENSDIEKGLVVFNGRNYLNHTKLISAEKNNGEYFYKIYKDSQIPLTLFYEQMANIKKPLETKIEEISSQYSSEGLNYWRNNLGIKNKTALQWVNFYFSSSLCMHENHIAVEKLMRPAILGEYIQHSIFVDMINKINDAFFGRIFHN